MRLITTFDEVRNPVLNYAGFLKVSPRLNMDFSHIAELVVETEPL